MNLTFRKADKNDLPAILEMVANDQLGRSREQFELPLPEPYNKAFEIITSDQNADLMVAEIEGKVIATFQLNYLQYLTYKGGMRVLVEGVRVHDNVRGQGIGKKVFEYIIQVARRKGAHLVQLTSNKKRSSAIKFYEALGFEASHEGFKLHL
ncbi:MAG: GNAT family N-acetyltransferase [Cyclobacteriaceae bacterium]